MSSFSDMLTYLRKRENLSQQELAEKTGLTRSAIGMYETGKREPDFETLEKIADFFNVNMDTLLGKSSAFMLNISVGSRIRAAREAKNMTQEELGAACGITKQSIFKYESGIITNIPLDRLEKIASALDVTPAYLMGWKEAANTPPGFQPIPPMTEVPLVGRIACGDPILAEENVEDMVSVPAAWRATFTLICHGDSMSPRIQDGDLVAIRMQPEVENGEIAAVRIENEATLKRVYLHDDYIELRPENPAFASIIHRRDEMNNVHIEGKAVGICRGI